MSEVDSKDFVCDYSRENMIRSFSLELQNNQRHRDTIPNLNNILFKNKMLFNSFY